MAGRRPEYAGFRLTFADDALTGGQVMKTYKAERPGSVKRLIELLLEERSFRFADICKERGANMKHLDVDKGKFLVTGRDGHRHVPIISDAKLSEFLMGVQYSPMPTLEIRVPQAPPTGSSQPGEPVAASAPLPESVRGSGNEPRDHTEKLEVENFKLLRSVDRVERQLDELERRITTEHDHTESLVELLRKELVNSQNTVVTKIDIDITALQAKDAHIEDRVDVLKGHIERVERITTMNKKELDRKIVELDESTTGRFEKNTEDLDELRMKDNLLEEEDVRLDKVLKEHFKLIENLDIRKVDMSLWDETEQAMQKYMDENFEQDRTRVNNLEAEIKASLEKLREDMVEADEALTKELKTLADYTDVRFEKSHAKMDAGFVKVEHERAVLEKVMLTKVDGETTILRDKMNAGFRDLNKDLTDKNGAMTFRVDELKANTEKTFETQWAHIEEMVRVERARLGTLRKDLDEGLAKTRSDFRAEIERFRGDYEQDSARKEEDLNDLHMKQDVTKQEINFFQSRLLEQRDWSQRQFTETQTATRASQVDCQEGLAAAQKMLHALRDDAVGFREKMAKYISLLQHTTDGHGDAISSLETHRGRMRLELDALIGDHKNYTCDMDGWADDVRVKVERLFRALEPAKVEWRIQHAAQKLKSLRRPEGMKSPLFALKGIREGQMELYPEGTNNSPPGKACLRVIFPPGACIRFQCFLGKLTDGAREYGQEAAPGLTVDLYFDSWKDQVRDDGTVTITMESIRDHLNDDESLAREIRIETL